MRTRTALPLLLPVLLAACEALPTPPGAPAESTGLFVQVSVAGTPIATLAVEVAAPDIPTRLVFNLALTDGAATGTLRVPAGSQRTFTARAFDAAGTETHRGERTATVRPGDNPPLSIVLLPLQGGQPLELTIGSYQVSVSPREAGLVVGAPLRLRAEVRDAAGQLVSASLQWASLDPAIATVSSVGLVAAVGAGEARIVAVHAGVGAAARITVEAP
jgi:hypothetical protein